MYALLVLALLAFARAEESENLIKVNFHEDCQKAVNELIQLNLAATYQYVAKTAHFSQYDSDYAGMAMMFNVHAREKMNDVKHLRNYLSHRGVEISYGIIPAPPVSDWSHPADVIKQALEIEKNILNHIISTHTCAQNNHDPDLMHDMADRMIVGEENTIFELGSYIQHFAHDGVSDALVLPALSRKMVEKYKDYKDCFHAYDETVTHDY